MTVLSQALDDAALGVFPALNLVSSGESLDVTLATGSSADISELDVDVISDAEGVSGPVIFVTRFQSQNECRHRYSRRVRGNKGETILGISCHRRSCALHNDDVEILGPQTGMD